MVGSVVHELVPGDELVIGRADFPRGRDASLVVSGRHLSIRHDDGWIARDLESTNGTYLGGEPMLRHPLTGPIELRLGDPEFGEVVRVRPVPAVVLQTGRIDVVEPSPSRPLRWRWRWRGRRARSR